MSTNRRAGTGERRGDGGTGAFVEGEERATARRIGNQTQNLILDEFLLFTFCVKCIPIVFIS